MGRTPARVTKADIRRALKAAKQAGAAAVSVLPDGTMRIELALDDGIPGPARHFREMVDQRLEEQAPHKPPSR